jgi:hypothetical protein
MSSSNTGQPSISSPFLPSPNALRIPATATTMMEGSSSPVPAGGAYTLQVRWCWKETDVRISLHPPADIVGDTSDGMIVYPKNTSDAIEATFQAQKGIGQFSPMPNYVINFDTMQQTNIRTGYQRDIQRVVDTAAIEMPVVPPVEVEEANNDTAAGAKDTLLINLSLAGNDVCDYGSIKPDQGTNNFNFDASSPYVASQPTKIVPPPYVASQPTKIVPPPYVASQPTKIVSSSPSMSPQQQQQPYGGTTMYSGPPIPTLSNPNLDFVAAVYGKPPPSANAEMKVRWCWKETPARVPNHPASSIIGDPANCWIAYDDQANRTLEDAYTFYQRGKGKCQPQLGYTVDFDTMKQTKILTGYERGVQRVVENCSSCKIY